MTLHISYEHALYFLTALTAVYLVMGGYFAVAVSDFIRGIIEFAGVLIMVYLLAHRPETGGFIDATRKLISDPQAAPALGGAKLLGAGSWLAVSAPGWLTLLALVLITSFGPWALPQMVQKFYSIRSKADVTRAMTIAGIFALFMAFGAYYSGALTHLFYSNKLPGELIADKPLTAGDIKDLPALVAKLQTPNAFSQALRAQLSPPTASLLAQFPGAPSAPPALAAALVKDLNRVVKGDSLYQESRFEGVALSQATLELARSQPKKEKLAQLNRLLLTEAYAPLLGKINKEPIWDKIMPHFIMTSGLPLTLVMVIVLMVFSASMSSLSSLVLVSSSAIAIDIYGAFVNRHANQKQTMALLRILCAIFVGCSLYIALKRPVFIVNLMIMSWGTLLGVFLAPYFYGLFWKRTTLAGVYAGIVVGLLSAVTLFTKWGQDGVPLAGAITMTLPLIVVPAVSLLTRPPEKELLQQAFGDQPALARQPAIKA